ncbi:hypothetical protein LSH36_1371g00047 [Paralvinella palmiformis]|uniref:Uncharacterized protein n=1 Tax=Paralvinella palmiformis TaxID=53620 RepID=A0AAD9IU94_9ANNE|nr:hypothetical protein LSH36_1371g00047 [Paralvinella palmiformis]
MSNVTIVRCHRLRKLASSIGPRNDIVRMLSHLGNISAMKSDGKLKGRERTIYINDKFMKEINIQHAILRPITKLGKQCSSEQHYQHQVIHSINNNVIVAEIQDTRNPVTIKHVGDRINDTGDWTDRHPRVIREEGVRAKFTHHHELA